MILDLMGEYFNVYETASMNRRLFQWIEKHINGTVMAIIISQDEF